MRIIKEIGRNPIIDWMTLLAVSTLVLITLVFVSFTLYKTVTDGSIEESLGQTSTSFKKVNEKAISTVVDRLEAKAEATKRFRSGYSVTSDPSI
jgi:hypothetical protein